MFAKDPDELSGTYMLPNGKILHKTPKETRIALNQSCILLRAKKRWLDKEFMPEDEAIALQDRMVNEIQGMDKQTYPGFAIDHDY